MKVCLRHGLRYQAAGTHKRMAGSLCFLSGAARRGPPKLFIILYSLFFQSKSRASALLSLSKNPIIKQRNSRPRLQKSKNISQKLASKGVSTPSLQAFSDSWQQI